jgi:GT2 family glycosyltransferase
VNLAIFGQYLFSVADISIIVPFHRNVAMLQRVLAPFQDRPASAEIVIAVDGPTSEDWEPVAREVGARGVQLPVRSGPAAARNRAAEGAAGRILMFVDGDVIAAPDALDRVLTVMREEPGVAAVFGAYDASPEEAGFVSQYKNLSHRYVHCTTAREARTFWAGLGAVRAEAFRAVGGFDESFRRPCVEDIELGYRLTGAGYRIVVEPSIQGKHLKRWTVGSAIRSDIIDRGIPWTQLLLRVASSQRDLNLTSGLRLSVIASYLLVLLAVLAIRWPAAGVVAAVPLMALLILNRQYYRYFRDLRGWWFAARVVPLHFVHHLCNGVSFLAGTLLYQLRRRFRWTLPGSLPSSSAENSRRERPVFGA